MMKTHLFSTAVSTSQSVAAKSLLKPFQKYFSVLAFMLSSVGVFGQTVITSQVTAGDKTVVVPAGVAKLSVEATGGGGGGGSNGSNAWARGSGGAGGTYIKHLLSVSAATYNFTAGAGGASSTVGNDSFFGNTTAGISAGSTVLANGGAAGLSSAGAGTGNTVWNTAAANTAVTTGSLPASGYVVLNAGTSGSAGTGTGNNPASKSGAGGAGAGYASSSAGGAGAPVVSGYSGPGTVGSAPGGGGSGGIQAATGTLRAGGAGGVGKVVVTYYVVPTVGSLSVSSGASGTSVTVTGTNFYNGLSKITIDGTEITTTYLSSTTISGTITGAAGAHSIGVNNSDTTNTGFGISSSTSTSTFTIAAAGITSLTSGNWSAPGTWVGNIVPSVTDNVIIDNGHTVTVDIAITRNSGTTTTINATGVLALSAAVTNNEVASAFLINGTVQVNGGGYASGTAFAYAATGSTLIMNHNSGLYGISTGQAFWPAANPPFNVNIQGTGAQIFNTVGSVAGTLSVNSKLQCSTGSAVTISGTAILGAELNISTPGGFVANGTLQINGGGFVTANSPTYGASSILVYNTNYTTSDMEFPVSGVKNVTITAPSGTSTVTLNNDKTITGTFIVGTHILNGGKSITAATITIGTGSMVMGDITTSTSLTCSGASSISLSGNWNVTGFTKSTSTVNFTNSGNINVATSFFNLTNSGGTRNITQNINVEGTLSVTGGQMGVTGGTGRSLTMSGATSVISIAGGSVFGTDAGSGNDLSLIISGAQTTFTGTASGVADDEKKFFNVTVNTGSKLNLARGIFCKYGTFAVNGTAILQIDPNGYVSGTVSGVVPTYSNTSSLVYNGVTGYGVNNEWTGNATTAGSGTPQNVTLTGSSVNMPSSARSLAGNLTIDATSAFNLNGAFGSDLNIGGNWNKIGAGAFSANNSAVFFRGTGAQTLTGGTTFDYLTLNNATGLTLQASSAVNVNQTLDFTSGKITLGTNDLTIGNSGTITNATSSKYIVTNGTGRLIKNAVGATAFNFPIGLNVTNYTPVSVTNTTGTSDLSVNVVNPIVNAPFEPTQVVNLQWNIGSSAATTATVSPTWIPATPTNQAASFTNTGTGEVGNYTSSYAIYPVTLNTTTTSATGVALQSGSNAIVVGNTGAVFTASTANDYYRSKNATGNWNDRLSWETSIDGTSNWTGASIAPTSSAKSVTIKAGNTITVTATASANQLTIDSGGTIAVNAGFSLVGITTVNGTWNQTSSTAVANSGTLTFNGTGIYNHNLNGGTIPTANWNVTSNCNILGFTNSSPVDGVNGIAQSFGNLTFNNANSGNYINMFSTTGSITVNGILTVGPSTNNEVSFNNIGGTVTATINKLNINGGALNAVGATATVNMTVLSDLTLSGNGTFINSSSSGIGNVTVNNDVILNGSSLLNIVGGLGSTTSQTLNIGRDLTISGVDAQIDMKPGSSSTSVATINVGRNFSSNNSSISAIDVDFGDGFVTNNAINITGNFSHSGNGKYFTASSGLAKGFVFKGGTATTPIIFSYSGTNSNYTSYVVDTGAYLKLLTDLSLGSLTGPISTFTINTGTVDFNINSIIGNSTAQFNTTTSSSLITSNSGGFGGTATNGSLKSFNSLGVTTLNGRAQLVAGLNYIFNANTITPFPNGSFGNPANISFNNAQVISNRTSNLIVSGNVNINGSSNFALNSTNNNSLDLGGIMTIDPNATFDNGGENQITNGGGSILINGTFVTRDVQGFTGTGTAIPGITPTLGANSTVVYGLNGNQAVSDFAYRNITFAGGGIKTAGTTSSIIGTVTINNGVILDTASWNFGGIGTKVTMLGNSLFKTGGNDNKPDATGIYMLDANSTIEFQGTSATKIKVSVPYENIIVSGNNVEPSAKNLAVNQYTTITNTGKLTIPSTGFSVSPNVITAKKGITILGNGILNLENNAQLMQDTGANNSGSITAKREATIPAGGITQYVYWSSPVDTQNYKAIFGGNTTALYYSEKTDKFLTSSGSPLPGRGLAVKNPDSTPGIITAQFKGKPFVGDLSYSLDWTDATHGYNLVGNPYPSNLDLNLLYSNSNNIESTFQFWDNTSNTQQSQLGSGYQGYSYAIYNPAAGNLGSGNPAPGNGTLEPAGIKAPNRILKIGQGFIARATSGSASLNFKNEQRITTQTAAQFFGRTAVDSTNNRYYLEMITPANLRLSNTIVYFNNGNSDFAIDDSRLENSVSDALYTFADTEKVIINGRSTFTNTDVLKVGNKFFVAGNYQIRLGKKEGIFENGQNIYLKDIQTGIITNLSEGSYGFTANAGENTGRFEIIYKPETILAINQIENDDLIVFRNDEYFVIRSAKGIIEKVEVLDTSGKLIITVNTNNKEVNIDNSAIPSGVYILKIKRNEQIISKKIIR